MTPFSDDELNRLPVPPQVFASFLASLMQKVLISGRLEVPLNCASEEEVDVTAFI